MNRNILFLLTLIVILSLPIATFAESEDGAMEAASEVTETVTPSTSRKADLEAKREAAKTAFEEKRAAAQATFEAKREEAQAAFEARREEAKEKFESKREEFKLKLAEIKDERKQAIVERVDTRLAEKNSTLTDRLFAHLDKMTEILDRLEERATETSNTAADTAIAEARTAVADARTAVESQAVKEYIVTLGDESELKTDVSAVVTQFRTDMKETAETVKAAREKTAAAARTLGAAPENETTN
ncbi:hypothetical protein KBD81_01010 [Candidatus Woesebacteria bacterium]|nr:hypothetical protein [Candidatus Woesebacteria bacterium]